MYWDRFDICEAYYVAEMLWNVGGIMQERESNQRRNMSTGYQLHRMRFNPRPSLNDRDSLTENGQAIYDALLARCGLVEVENEELGVV